MKLPQDFREYLELFNAKGVEYMSEERSEPTKHRCHRPKGDSRKSPPLGSNCRARRNVFEKTYGLRRLQNLRFVQAEGSGFGVQGVFSA